MHTGMHPIRLTSIIAASILRKRSRTREEGDHIVKTVSMLLALVNSLAAGLVIAASLPAIQLVQPVASLGNATRVLLSMAVLATGVLTWVAACRETNPALLFLAGLFLVALGTASAVWTIHVALSSGAIKDYMILYGGSLMAQGASSLWSLLSAAKPPAGL
jgi:hypothetical protein